MANEPEPHLSTDEARAGSTPGIARPVLFVSLALIVVLFGALLIYYR